MKNYNACTGVEKALIQQIVKALHEDWLSPLRNTTTDMIQGTIPVILQYLFTRHGNVSADALDRKEGEIKQMHYNPEVDSLDTVFNAVDELAEFATAAGLPYTRPQKIKFAYLILKRLKVFNQAIVDWNKHLRRTPANNTWINFKIFFRQQYDDLKEVGELTIANTQFSHANLVSQIVDAVQESIANAEPTQPPIVTSIPPPTLSPSPTFTPTANIATAPPALSNDPMAALIQQIMLMNNNLVNSLNQSGRSTRGGGGRGRGGGSRYHRRGGRGRGRESRPRTMRYCWTCGWTYHDGAHCRTPAEGHEPTATIYNRMGGSVECLPPGYE